MVRMAAGTAAPAVIVECALKATASAGPWSCDTWYIFCYAHEGVVKGQFASCPHRRYSACIAPDFHIYCQYRLVYDV